MIEPEVLTVWCGGGWSWCTMSTKSNCDSLLHLDVQSIEWLNSTINRPSIKLLHVTIDVVVAGVHGPRLPVTVVGWWDGCGAP